MLRGLAFKVKYNLTSPLNHPQQRETAVLVDSPATLSALGTEKGKKNYTKCTEFPWKYDIKVNYNPQTNLGGGGGYDKEQR